MLILYDAREAIPIPAPGIFRELIRKIRPVDSTMIYGRLVIGGASNVELRRELISIENRGLADAGEASRTLSGRMRRTRC